MKKIVICGGHLTPALALIEELEKNRGLEMLFFGRKFATEGSSSLSAEYRQVTGQNIRFFSITAGRLTRRLTRYTLFSLLKVPLGFVQSFVYLILRRPNLIVSFGGYLSCPVIFCGWLLGIKSITHEQAPVAGLANKINSIFAQEIFLAWPQAQPFFPKEKSQTIGNPVRKSIFNKKAQSKKIARFLRQAKKLLYVTGGNQGSHSVNSLIFESLDILGDFHILHQVGTANFKGDLETAFNLKETNYLAVDYIEPGDIGAVLDRASIVLSRAGANVIWELASLAKVAILIPLPIAAGNEQEAGAKILTDAGMAEIIREENLSPTSLRKILDKTLKNYQSYQKAAEAFQKTLPKNTAFKLAQQVLKYIHQS